MIRAALPAITASAVRANCATTPLAQRVCPERTAICLCRCRPDLVHPARRRDRRGIDGSVHRPLWAAVSAWPCPTMRRWAWKVRVTCAPSRAAMPAGRRPSSSSPPASGFEETRDAHHQALRSGRGLHGGDGGHARAGGARRSGQQHGRRGLPPGRQRHLLRRHGQDRRSASGRTATGGGGGRCGATQCGGCGHSRTALRQHGGEPALRWRQEPGCHHPALFLHLRRGRCPACGAGGDHVARPVPGGWLARHD